MFLKSKIILSNYYELPFKDKHFDFTIAFNSIYMQSLGDIIRTLKEINRVSKKSYIVLASGHKGSSELVKEIQDFCKNLTAPYKYPRKIEFVLSLPKTISGKIRRVELREITNK